MTTLRPLFRYLAGILVAVTVITTGIAGLQASAAQNTAADFRTSLTTSITSSATSLTVSAISTASGENLLVGKTYGLKLGGREYVLGTLSTGRQFTSLTRGVSTLTGTSTVGGVAEAWGRGTTVEITTAPSLLWVTNILNGTASIDQPISYSSSVATTTIAANGNNLVNVQLLNDTSFSALGLANASTILRGLTQLATALQTASSTATGSTGAALVVPASNATSTYNSATAALKVVVTQNSGKIDSNFLPSTIPTTAGNNTWTGINTFATTTATSTVIGSSPAYWIGKNVKVFSATGVNTFTVPSGINKVWVRLVGGGGGGGGACTNTTGAYVGASGGSAAYVEKMVDITGTTTVQVFVGSGGNGGASGSGGTSCGTGGTGTATTFSTYFSAAAGTGGAPTPLGGPGSGGSGGTATGGDVNINGTPGQSGMLFPNGTSIAGGFIGGASPLSGYGNGGASGSCSSGSTCNSSGSTGAQGYAIIIW